MKPSPPPSLDVPPVWEPAEQPPGPPLVAPVEPLDVDDHRRRTYASYERFLFQTAHELDARRPEQWSRDYTNPQRYADSIEPMRQRLIRMLGFWTDPADRPPVVCRETQQLGAYDTFTATRFRMDILPGLETYAVMLVPAAADDDAPRPGLLVQHGYGASPELALGLTRQANLDDYSYRSIGIRAVRRGYVVIAPHHPTGYGTLDDPVHSSLPDFPLMPMQYGKNRLHRLATLVGGTLFGLDLLASSRALDILAARPDVDAQRLGMYGLSQGGQTALHLPALDRRIRASVCSAYFNCRIAKLIGPTRALSYLDSTEEDKFFPGLLRYFSDANIASLIAPRAFAVEAGLLDSSVDFEPAHRAFEAVAEHYQRLGLPDHTRFIPHREGHVCATRAAFEFLGEHLKPSQPAA